jgi:hypothetical protein
MTDVSGSRHQESQLPLAPVFKDGVRDEDVD